MRVSVAVYVSLILAYGLPSHFTVGYDRGAWSDAAIARIKAATDAVGVRALPVGRASDVYLRVHAHDGGWHVGLYDETTRTIDVWRDDLRTLDALQNVVTHELLHALGGDHVCRYAGELPDPLHAEVCAPVGTGLAILNPVASERLTLSALDVAEIRRHRPHWTP